MKAIQQQQKDPVALPRESEEKSEFIYLLTYSPSSSLLEALMEASHFLKNLVIKDRFLCLCFLRAYFFPCLTVRKW